MLDGVRIDDSLPQTNLFPLQGIPSSSAGTSDNTGVFDPSLLVPTSSDQSIGGGDSMTSLQQVSTVFNTVLLEVQRDRVTFHPCHCSYQ